MYDFSPQNAFLGWDGGGVVMLVTAGGREDQVRRGQGP